MTNSQLADRINPSAVEANTEWQQSIDQAALLMLALRAVTVPFLGVQRSASVLLANFGSDYRVLAPLTSLSYLQVTAEQGIFVREEQVFDRLRAVGLILVDAGLDNLATILREAAAVEGYTVQQAPATVDALLAEVKQQRAQGYHLAYFTSQVADAPDDIWGDVLICCVESRGFPDTITDAHVVLSPSTPAQAQTLITLTDDECRQRQMQNFALSLVLSLVNLWSIFFLRFSPVTALIIDYGGMGIDILNAMWPRLQANLRLKSLSTHE